MWLAAVAAGLVCFGAAVALSNAATPSSTTVAIFTIPSADYSEAAGHPLLPITAIRPAAGSSQNEWFILTSASGTSVLQEPVAGGTPTVTAIDLGAPTTGYPA